MATDYDTPRKTDEELHEESLEELKAQRVDAQSGQIDVDEAEAAETIDADSAKEAYEQAQTKWEQASGQKEKVEANIALKRARARYQVVKATA